MDKFLSKYKRPFFFFNETLHCTQLIIFLMFKTRPQKAWAGVTCFIHLDKIISNGNANAISLLFPQEAKGGYQRNAVCQEWCNTASWSVSDRQRKSLPSAFTFNMKASSHRAMSTFKVCQGVTKLREKGCGRSVLWYLPKTVLIVCQHYLAKNHLVFFSVYQSLILLRTTI